MASYSLDLTFKSQILVLFPYNRTFSQILYGIIRPFKGFINTPKSSLNQKNIHFTFLKNLMSNLKAKRIWSPKSFSLYRSSDVVFKNSGVRTIMKRRCSTITCLSHNQHRKRQAQREEGIGKLYSNSEDPEMVLTYRLAFQGYT